MALASTVLALMFVRKMPADELPTRILEEAFVYTSIAYEYGGPMQLPDAMYDSIGLELLCRKDKCSVDFHMAVNWDILRFKATNLALDFNSPMCKEAERDMRVMETLLGG